MLTLGCIPLQTCIMCPYACVLFQQLTCTITRIYRAFRVYRLDPQDNFVLSNR